MSRAVPVTGPRDRHYLGASSRADSLDYYVFLPQQGLSSRGVADGCGAEG